MRIQKKTFIKNDQENKQPKKNQTSTRVMKKMHLFLNKLIGSWPRAIKT